MIVFVKYLGYFSQITGKKEEKIAIEKGLTVEDLLNILSSKYGRKFEEALSRGEYRGVVVIVNGESVDKDYVLSHGDKVVVSFPIGGGCA